MVLENSNQGFRTANPQDSHVCKIGTLPIRRTIGVMWVVFGCVFIVISKLDVGNIGERFTIKRWNRNALCNRWFTSVDGFRRHEVGGEVMDIWLSNMFINLAI